MEVGDFLEAWPSNAQELAATERRARKNPLYRDFVLSADGTTVGILIETQVYSSIDEVGTLDGFDEDVGDGFGDAMGDDDVLGGEPADGTRTFISGAEDLEIVQALRLVLGRHARPGLEVHMAGSPAFSAVLSERMGGDMGRFTGLSIGLVAFFLAALFRRAAAVFLPLLTVSISVVSTMAFMGLTDTAMMPPTQIIPSFLLAVGIGGAVHLLAIFYQARRAGQEKPDAISHALAHSGLPIVMTSLTTAGGLLSFVPAALRPISQFGWVMPVGVLLSLTFVLTLLPALMALVPMRSAEARSEDAPSQRFLVDLGRFSTRHAWAVLLAWLALMLVSSFGIARVTIGHHMLEWFPEIEPMRQATVFMNERFGGAASYEVLISTGSENGIHDPDFLRRLAATQTALEELDANQVRARKAVSITDVVKETHRALNENREAFYAIPEERALVSQELLLFENSGSDDVEDLVTSGFDTARLTARVPFVDGAFYNAYLDAVEARLRELMGPNVDIEITGSTRMMGSTIHSALQTMLTSYSTALIVITLLMIVLIGNVRMGFLSMVPNLAPVLFAVGLMGWLRAPLDMFSLMTGTIVIGLAVDDTIHFMHNFRREFDRTGDVDRAVEHTLRGTGQALLFTSCVLVFGFLVYTQAYMVHLFNFGIVTALAIFVAFLADVTLAPALVKLATRDRVETPGGSPAPPA